MPTQILTPGYTWYATLDGFALSVTSFSLDITRNLIKSNAPCGFTSSKDKPETIKKLMSQILPDWTQVKISISSQATQALMNLLFSHISTKRNKVLKVLAKDAASDTEFKFDECYLLSFSFDISEGGVLIVNLELMAIVAQDTYVFSINKYTNGGKTQNHSPFNSTVKILSYLDCTINGLYDIISLNFNFSQDIIPKFGMIGQFEEPGTESPRIGPPQPYKLLFGLPNITLGYSQMTTLGASVGLKDMFSITYNEPNQARNIAINCGGKVLTCKDCVLQNFSPVIADKSSYTIVEYEYSVLGYLDYIVGT